MPDTPAAVPGPVTVGDVVGTVTGWYPPSSAESWDAVGTVCGEPGAGVDHVLLTVDVTPAIVAQARELGAQLIIAHHPLLLKGVHAVDVDTPKGRMITDLIGAGIALHCAHTNADVGPGSTVAALAATLGLRDPRPLQPHPAPALDTLVTFVPVAERETVVDALAAAGAGAIGDYDRCFFAAPGEGSFRPGAGAEPYLGSEGEIERVAEERVELVLPRERRDAVVAALLTAHPYEQPAWHLVEHAERPSDDTGLGRIGTVEPITVADFARLVADRLPATAGGVRVCGDPDRVVSRVAVQAGAGDGLLDTARRASAELYLTSDLRHHPASEASLWPDAPALLDVAHWAAEWTWLPVLRDRLAAALPDTVTITVSELRTDPWTSVVGASSGS